VVLAHTFIDEPYNRTGFTLAATSIPEVRGNRKPPTTAAEQQQEQQQQHGGRDVRFIAELRFAQSPAKQQARRRLLPSCC
jgi:hypothetical protein